MKVLIRAPNWIGDAVMAVPALRLLRETRPDSEITILARPGVADLLREQRLADNMIVFDNKGRHKGFSGGEALAAELRGHKFDAALLLQNAFEAAWLAWRAGIPVRTGYARDARSFLLTMAVPVPRAAKTQVHQARYYLQLAEHFLGGPQSLEIPAICLRISDSARDAAEAKLRAAGCRNGAARIAVAPGASYGAAKCWPPERFAALADRLISESDADVIFFGTPGETEIVKRIQSGMRHQAISLAGQTSPSELAALLTACSGFIGNDSGAMHVAAAAGLPVIGIFGPTDPLATAPVTSRFTLIREPFYCSPCLLRRCPIDHRCMTGIEVDRVFRAAVRERYTGKREPPCV